MESGFMEDQRGGFADGAGTYAGRCPRALQPG
jgi:hypothetical protein